MEDEDGYMAIESGRRDLYMQPSPKEAQGDSSSNCCKITTIVSLIGSLALNVALIILIIVFQVRNAPTSSCPLPLPNSCEWIPGSSTERVLLDPRTAHRRIIISPDQRSAKWGPVEQPLPNNTERFDQRVWVLGNKGYPSGKHCWEVEVKGNGEWAVGVAKESVKRKGLPDFSTTEGIWGIGEYWGLGNYLAFTAPQHTPLPLVKKPRMIRVFLDHGQGSVEFFDAEAKASIYTFTSAPFSGETILPWFRVWNGTELVLHP
uniref:B30.2/SPRY domain-containing protein n=1 Tax=Anolis carolinensis TaxID=28377 RepID=A0A803TFD0_ANOCA|nr:PREDICTED: butyrophilin subfamily 1 member A1 [Anolis carolinensis]|eukprot:XP_008103877.1 PREDICTED: butyrophilin subfamily 1 member A1 [Anolis carolinensis]